MSKRIFNNLFVFAVVLFLAPSAFSEPYFSAEKIPPKLLDAPLKPKSEEWKKEIEFIVTMQQRAEKSEIEKAAAERRLGRDMMTVEVIPSLTRERYPAVFNLLGRVRETQAPINDNAKKYWNTKRPYLMDTRIRPLIEPANNPAYPSGHTSESYAYAYVLAMLLPQYSEKFFKRAGEIASHRVLAGMHYPHDVKGGKDLALLVFNELKRNPDFMRDFDTASHELEQQGLKK